MGEPDNGGVGDDVVGANDVALNGGAGIEIAATGTNALGTIVSSIEDVVISGDYAEFIYDDQNPNYPGPDQQWIWGNLGDGIWAHAEIFAEGKAEIESLVIQDAGIGVNGGYGIRLEGPEGTQQGGNAVVRRNQIGIDPEAIATDYGNDSGGILLADDTVGATLEANFVAYNGSTAAPAPGIRVDDDTCEGNLISENSFFGNSGSPIVLASGSQNGLADATPTIGGIAQSPTGWSVPVTLSAGSTFGNCEFAAEFYAYNDATEHYYVLTDDGGDPIEATASAESDGSVTIWGEIALDDIDDLPAGYEVCALVYCSDESAPALVGNTTVFSASTGFPTVRVVGEYVFYNDSAWDVPPDPDPNPGYDYDNDAVDDSKEAFYSGETATLDNVTCYGKGLNGIMIDVTGFTGNTADVTAEDFDFYVWDASTLEFDAISDPTVSMYSYTAGSGEHRIKFIFDNNTVVGTWLKIDVLASGDLGLAHTFYFGNLAGDMTGGAGIPSPPDWSVNSADLDLIRANWGATLSGMSSWQDGDCSGDEAVNSGDLDVVRANWGATLDDDFAAPSRAMASQSLSASSTPAWTDAADRVYERYGLLDDDPTNDVAIDEKFWEKLYKALGLTYSA